MSCATVTHTKLALDRSDELYRAWRLMSSVTNASATNGTDNDPNIFVMRTDKRITGDKEVFSHVASLLEMDTLPASKADIPPKAAGFYRSSILELDFANELALDLGIDLIDRDVELLMYSASDTTVQEVSSIVANPNVRDINYYGVSASEFSALTTEEILAFDVAYGPRGHAGLLIPDNQYIYVLYPEDKGECTYFSIAGFITDPWPTDTITITDLNEHTDTLRVYRSPQKIDYTPGGATYDVH